MMPPRMNPFSSRFVEPGAMAYRFFGSVLLDELVQKLETHHGWGQIVGPHGSGKSTLLESLLPRLTGWNVCRFRLTMARQHLPEQFWSVARGKTVLVVDGFEQLHFWRKWQAKRHAQTVGAGLLITAHRDLGLPMIYQTGVTAEHAESLVEKLLPDRVQREIILKGYSLAERLQHHQGSLREVFFELYDRWEAWQRSVTAH